MQHEDYSASFEDAKSWIDGGGEFLSPSEILEDLTEEQARAVPAGSPYAIAQVVAHMHYWQGGGLAKRRGQEWPKAEHLDDTFAMPALGAWEKLRADFLSDLEEIKGLADEHKEYHYVSRALHNAYHLGQIVLIRRELGIWPPAAGEAYDF